MMGDDFDYSAFIGQFVTECQEHLVIMNADLLTLESEPENAEMLGEIVREAHTIKGAAKMMGAEEIASLAHKMEDVLGEVKENRAALGGELADVLFKGFDALGNLLKAFSGETAPAVDAAALTEALDKFMPGQDAKVDSGEVATPAKDAVPKTERADDETTRNDRRTRSEDIKMRSAEETIRVNAKKIDELANLASELLITHIRQKDRELTVKNLIDTYKDQAALLRSLRESLREARLTGLYFPDLERLEAGRQKMDDGLQKLYRAWREDNGQMGVLVDGLTQEVLSVRMVPVSTLFDTFARPVRDLAKASKKEVELHIEGGDTEFDRRMIEIIQDPMIHMLRNSIDHGIETPEERLAAGKPKAGLIRLKASQEGEYVVIELIDDGAGIDLEKVRAKAIKKKLIEADKADNMSEADLMQLIFKAGFSTSDIITDISGRGVGMDVVRSKIEELKGMVYLKSEKGAGTTITLKVPLTLAMSRVMFVRAGGQAFAIPTTSIEEAIRVAPEAIETIEGRAVISLRDHSVPLMRLAAVMGLEEVLPAEDKKSPAVIINLGDQKVGLVVDELIYEHEVVIKTIGPYFKDVRNVAGATVLSSGEVVLILNPADLLSAAVSSGGAKAPEKPAARETVRQKRILVVDDSATTRELEKTILISAGYYVDEAIDGVDALAKVKKSDYDLLVVDVQMPRMDGLTLTKRIRSDERFENLPIVMVTTLEKDEDRQRGAEAGADAYIIKRAFDQASLLSVIEQLTAA
jgi:two-component system, chemotaxis family, sensor kinase CheA